MDAPDPETQAGHIRDAIFRGRKIEAIKRYREETGAGLAEAKKAVEDLEQQLRVSSPEMFSAPAGKAGCGAAVGALVVLAVVLLWVLASGWSGG
jgi:ribosomal protein L7/L12